MANSSNIQVGDTIVDELTTNFWTVTAIVENTPYGRRFSLRPYACIVKYDADLQMTRYLHVPKIVSCEH